MAQYFDVHPVNPQPRLLKQAAGLLEGGGIVAVPTDSSYALACHLDDKAAADRLRQIRGVDDKHHLTLLCRDLSELANYAANSASRTDAASSAPCGARKSHASSNAFDSPASRAASRTRRAARSGCACPTTACCRSCWRCTPRLCWRRR